MRKFIILLGAVLAFTVAQAQTVEHPDALENIFVTVSGGGQSTSHGGGHHFFWRGAENIAKSFRPAASVEIGKWITPAVGFSFEGTGLVNTTGSRTFFDQSDVTGNVKFNLSNLFGRYKGEPRRVEILAVPGLGWGHDYGNIYYDRNYLTYHAGAEIAINIGKAKAWQIVLKPQAVWSNYNNMLKFHSKNLQGRILLGVSYKIGSRTKGSHNFVLCPYSVKRSDYDAIKAENAELKNRKPEIVEVVKKEIVHDTVTVQAEPEDIMAVYVNFEKNSSRIYESEMSELDDWVRLIDKNTKILVTGSADTKTGTEIHNKVLARKRAEAVKKYLENKHGFTDVKTAVELDFFPNRAASRVAVVTEEQ